MERDEKRLETGITAAFDRLPDPEWSKLKRLEERLVAQMPRREQRRRPSLWAWWLIAALTATGAAAWWAGEYFWSHEQPPSAPSVTQSAEETSPGEKTNMNKEQVMQAPPRDSSTRGSEIFRREIY